MCAGKNAEPAILKGTVIQVNTHIQHGHDPLTHEQVAGAVGMPAHLGKSAVGCMDIIIYDQSVFFIFTNPSLIRLHQVHQVNQARVVQQFMEDLGVKGSETQTLNCFIALLIFSKFQGYPVYLFHALFQPFPLQALNFTDVKVYFFAVNNLWNPFHINCCCLNQGI